MDSGAILKHIPPRSEAEDCGICTKLRDASREIQSVAEAKGVKRERQFSRPSGPFNLIAYFARRRFDRAAL